MRVPVPENNPNQPKVLPPISEMMPAIVPVNNYIWQRFYESDLGLVSEYEGIPFFPVNTDSAYSDTLLTDNKTVVFYDRLFRYRPQSFYEIRKEQFKYTIIGEPVDVLQWLQAIQILLDGEDDSAKDINEWVSWQNGIIDPDQPAGDYKYPFFFHSMRAFIPAFNEFRGLSVSDGSTNQSIIIDVQYHYINDENQSSNKNFYSLKTPWKRP